MHPVLPRTMVRGPEAFTINFMTRADSHPWHVRCPEVKYSSSGTFLTPLKGSNCCVGKVAMASAMSVLLLLPDSDPVSLAEGLPRRRPSDQVGHLADAGDGDLASAQTADKGKQGRPDRR